MSDFSFQITTQRLRLVIPSKHLKQAMLDFSIRNVKHLEKTSPPPPEGAFSDAFWNKRIEQIETQFKTGQSARFTLLPKENSSLVIGGANINNIVRGAFQAGYLGYHIDQDYEGQGYMHEALSAVVDYAFSKMHLHRIMANYLPDNERSAKLLERLGFEREGYAREYLYINGAWRDHVLTSLTNRNLNSPE